MTSTSVCLISAPVVTRGVARYERMKRTALVMLTIGLTAATVAAKVDAPPDVGERAKGSSKVVLATVTDVESEFGENAYGESCQSCPAWRCAWTRP